MLDTSRAPAKRPRPGGGGAGSRTPGSRGGTAAVVRGPYGSAGPYDDGDERYEVRLERVPGGLRLADWSAGGIRRRAPVLAAADVAPLLLGAAERGALAERDADALRPALATEPDEDRRGEAGASPGRAGELRDELRVEALDGGRLRIARWVMRPGSGWELQEAPVMLPVARYAEALRKAARSGLFLA